MAEVIKVGALTNSFLKNPERYDTVGKHPPESYDYATNGQALIAEISKRLQDLEGQVELKVHKDGIPSAIILSKDAVLITSDRIGVLGDVTFADYVRDQSGTATGEIDPSVTRIRGGVIQTEQIISGNWSPTFGTVFDLDNGNIIIGGSQDPRFQYDNSLAKLTVRGDIVVEDTYESNLTTVKEYGKFVTGTAAYNAFSGFSGSGILVGSPGIYGLNNGNIKLGFDAATGDVEIQGNVAVGSTIDGGVYIGSKTGTEMQFETQQAQLTADTAQSNVESYNYITDVLENAGAQIRTSSNAFILVGSVTNGMYIGSTGIFGKKAGATTFSIDSAGNATFKGNLTGATGTFSGIVSTENDILCTGTVYANSVAMGSTGGSVTTASAIIPQTSGNINLGWGNRRWLTMNSVNVDCTNIDAADIDCTGTITSSGRGYFAGATLTSTLNTGSIYRNNSSDNIGSLANPWNVIYGTRLNVPLNLAGRITIYEAGTSTPIAGGTYSYRIT